MRWYEHRVNPIAQSENFSAPRIPSEHGLRADPAHKLRIYHTRREIYGAPYIIVKRV
jgi:hypothetical protein